MKIDDFGYVALRAHNISILLGLWHDTKFGNNNSLSRQGNMNNISSHHLL